MSVTTATEPAKTGSKYRAAKNPSPPLTQDQRTRIARRARTLEREYRTALERQGVVVDVHVDMTVGALADAMVRIEIARAAASRGMPTDPEVMTRWLNLAQRLANQLGLKPQVVEERPNLNAYLANRKDAS